MFLEDNRYVCVVCFVFFSLHRHGYEVFSFKSKIEVPRVDIDISIQKLIFPNFKTRQVRTFTSYISTF